MGPPAVAHSYFIPAYERMGLRPGLPLALLWGGAELVGGFLIASGLVTPVGTALLAGAAVAVGAGAGLLGLAAGRVGDAVRREPPNPIDRPSHA